MSVPIVATEDLGISLQKLREMIATSETFQEGVQGGYGDALERVHIGRQRGTPTRPFAVIEFDGLGANLIAGGSMNHLRLNGDIKLQLERDTNTDVDDPYTEAHEFFGGVLSDIQNLAAVDNTTGEFDESHLPTVSTTVNTVDENDIRDWASLGRFYVCRATISWGDG